MPENKSGNKFDDLQLVTFYLDKEEFGIDILEVKEIIRKMRFTKIPNSPHFVLGLINLRGVLTPVMDLRILLNIEPKELDSNSRIIIVELNETTIGFVVDSVNEVIRITQEQETVAGEIPKGIDNKFISSVFKVNERLLIYLNLEEIVINELFNTEMS